MTRINTRCAPESKTKSGGTIEFKVLSRLMKCSNCQKFLHKHYYVHQCNSFPHSYCFDCLIAKYKCKCCKDYYTHMYKLQ